VWLDGGDNNIFTQIGLLCVAMLAVAGVTAMETSVALFTVSRVEALTPLSVAPMLVVAATTARATPWGKPS
jgi:hypothetical protein